MLNYTSKFANETVLTQAEEVEQYIGSLEGQENVRDGVLLVRMSKLHASENHNIESSSRAQNAGGENVVGHF